MDLKKTCGNDLNESCKYESPGPHDKNSTASNIYNGNRKFSGQQCRNQELFRSKNTKGGSQPYCNEGKLSVSYNAQGISEPHRGRSVILKSPSRKNFKSTYPRNCGRIDFNVSDHGQNLQHNRGQRISRKHDVFRNRVTRHNSFKEYEAQPDHDIGNGLFYRDLERVPPRFRKIIEDNADAICLDFNKQGLHVEPSSLLLFPNQCTDARATEKTGASVCEQSLNCKSGVLPFSEIRMREEIAVCSTQQEGCNYFSLPQNGCYDVESVLEHGLTKTDFWREDMSSKEGWSGEKLVCRYNETGYCRERNVSFENSFKQLFGDNLENVHGDPISKPIMPKEVIVKKRVEGRSLTNSRLENDFHKPEQFDKLNIVESNKATNSSISVLNCSFPDEVKNIECLKQQLTKSRNNHFSRSNAAKNLSTECNVKSNKLTARTSSRCANQNRIQSAASYGLINDNVKYSKEVNRLKIKQDSCDKPSSLSQDSGNFAGKHKVENVNSVIDRSSHLEIPKIRSFQVGRKSDSGTTDKTCNYGNALNCKQNTVPSGTENVENVYPSSETCAPKLPRSSSVSKMQNHVSDIVIKVHVSEDVNNLNYWISLFRNHLQHENFEIKVSSEYTKTLCVIFFSMDIAKFSVKILKKIAHKDNGNPHIVRVLNARFDKKGKNPQAIKTKVVQDCVNEIDKLCRRAFSAHNEKISMIEDESTLEIHYELDVVASGVKLAKLDKLKELNEMMAVFQKYVKSIKEEVISMASHSRDIDDIKQAKKKICRECNFFKACLPIYAKKYEILDLVQQNQVSVLIAETGSGKSTQLVQYLYQNDFAIGGVIVCTQPRKISAVSIAYYVSGIMGSPVGGIVGYETGISKKVSQITKIVYMTDHTLLRKCVKNKNLNGISCIIVDEAHERTTNTDLLLGMIKKCLAVRPDLRIIITSATIDPSLFRDYFSLPKTSILTIPGRTYPVSVVWQDFDSYVGCNYLESCVKMAYKVHRENGKGNILAFLTSPNETEEAVTLFRALLQTDNDQSSPIILCFHGKQNLSEQINIFANDSKSSRKIIFATNSAETAVTIPGVKYVIDSGMVKEMQFHSTRKQNVLVVGFINKSSAEQRKGRAGRTEPGVCYRLYSTHNYNDDMPDRTLPEILNINLQHAVLKIMELGIKPEEFDFLEAPAKDDISTAKESLEFLGAIKDDKFTNLGKMIIKLPIEPRLGKLAILGIEHGIGYEAVILASLASVSGIVFYRNDENKAEADEKKILFCQEQGDFSTFLNVYRRWIKVPEVNKSQWCVNHCVNAKAMKIAKQTAQELIDILRYENIQHIRRTFQSLPVFQSKCEKILFQCFSENLCIYSGHKKIGYVSPFLQGSFFLHPSSSICYLKNRIPPYVVFSTVMKTSRNFLLDITPIKESTIIAANQNGEFIFQIDMLRCLQISPLRIWPVGESVLVKNILGKHGSNIREIQEHITSVTKSDNFHVDVNVENNEVLIHVEEQYKNKVLNLFNDIIQEGRSHMVNEEEICRLNECESCSFAIGCGGVVNDIILPGEFRDIEIECIGKSQDKNDIKKIIQEYGAVISSKVIEDRGNLCLLTTYAKVSSAEKAILCLQKLKYLKVTKGVSFSTMQVRSLPLFCLQVSWSRHSGSGTGWIKFHKLEDCIEASGILTMHSVSVADKYITVVPTKKNERELFMKNIPNSANTDDVMAALRDHLPGYIKIRQVTFDYVKCHRASETEMRTSKAQLHNLFSKYTPSNKLVINLKTPSPKDSEWVAQVFFVNFQDGEKALADLEGKARIGDHQVQIKPNFKITLSCEIKIFRTVEKCINVLIKYLKDENICSEFNVIPKNKTSAVRITFSCSSIENLLKVRKKITDLIHGHRIYCSDKPGYSKLFSKYGQKFLMQVQAETHSFVVSDSVRKSICIYGTENACSVVKSQIDCYATVSTDEETRTFSLGGKKMPLGLLKALRNRYGPKLHLLIDEFNLRAADIDVLHRKLTVEGYPKSIQMVEDCLACLCLKLSQISRDEPSAEKEYCPICFDVIAGDSYRLENCCHAFCRQCLLLQIESRVLPLVCAKEECEKPFFVEDLRKLFIGNEDLKKEFYDWTLKEFVSKNISELRYCPVPDCSMIYRVNSPTPEVSCLMCENDICTRCHDLYHHGMSCDMFQKTKVIKDYSLKVWLEEDRKNRKRCPKCSTAIEKLDGCDHMLCNQCNSHLCWRCLTIFSSGDAVYEHLPVCDE